MLYLLNISNVLTEKFLNTIIVANDWIGDIGCIIFCLDVKWILSIAVTRFKWLQLYLF